MLKVFIVIVGGFVVGRLFSKYKLGFVHKAITIIIWLLLFLLGLEVGSNPEVVAGITTLGLKALVISLFTIVGSILTAWLLWRYLLSKGIADER